LAVRSFVASAAILAMRAASLEPALRQGQDHVLAIAGDDDERPRSDPLQHVPRLHRPDRDAVDHPIEVRTRVDRLAVDPFENHPESRVRQDRPDGEDAEEADAVGAQSSLQNLLDARLGVEIDLVHYGPGDRHAVGREMGGIEDDLVDRPADAAFADDDRRRPEHPRHDRIRQADHRADAGMARPLDEEDVVVGSERIAGGNDAGAEVLDDLARDVLLREAAGDVNGAHRAVVGGERKDLVHEDRVLVRRLAVVDDGSLTDRLHEGGPQARSEEAVEEAQGGRGLAPVLAGGGQIELAHGR
jgi:hypothetical protein